MKSFVTGWQGYVGSAVCRSARRHGHRVHVLVRSGMEGQSAAQAGLVPILAKLDDLAAIGTRLAEMDALFHCAASDDPAFQPRSLTAVDAMLGHLAPRAALVVHGGSLVFGPTAPVPVCPDRLAPPPSLAERARIDQRLLDAAAGGQRAIGVYGSFVHGGAGAAIPRSWAAAARAAGFVACPGDGSALWALASLDDWADLMVLAAEAGQNGPLFAARQHVTVAALAGALGAHLHLPVRFVPAEQALLAGPFGAALLANQCFDAAPSRRLGWARADVRLQQVFAGTQID